MLEHLAWLVGGGVFLVMGADAMVDAAARLARRFGLSDVLIGLTLTSIGTSVPELAASVSAALQGSPELALGNVMGSNIANIGLILGVAALTRPIDTDQRVHERDGFVMFAAALILFVLALDNRLGRLDGLLLASLYVAYLAFLVRTDRGGIDHRFRSFLEHTLDLAEGRPLTAWLRRRRAGAEPAAEEAAPPDDPVEEAPQGRPVRDVLVLVVAIAAVMVGANAFTDEASFLAGWAGVPEAVIGLSLVAVGTSLPELTVSITAARKGNAGMVVGNVMGSNIANVLLIMGTCALITPVPVPEGSVVHTLPILLFFSLGLLYLVRSSWRVTRVQGGLTLVAYASFLTLAFVLGWG